MTSPRPARIALAVLRAFPDMDQAAVAAAVAASAGSDVALAELDKHLQARPDALTSGHSGAPLSAFRLIAELQSRGLAVVTPTCGSCRRTVRLPYTVGDQRWCVTCYSKTKTETCVACGKLRRVATRTGDGPLCGHCHRYGNPEPCVSCGALRPVTTRKADGPRCQACSDRPHRECSSCHELAPVHAELESGPVCRRCYRQPERTCGVCNRVGRIEIAATALTPDVCSQCYEAPLKQCPDCGLREPCAHDQEYYNRPGNENLGALDAEALARRRRMVPRPLRSCARCGRDRPVQALWPMGPVCSSCYGVVLKKPSDCPACGNRSVLIGVLDGEPVCGTCVGSARSYSCRACGESIQAVVDGMCARCYAQQQFDLLLEDADEAWEGLRGIPQRTESPMALVVWLRKSRGARLLRQLIEAGEPPEHSALPAGKAEHYLRSLLVEADVLPSRIEPLDRLPEWVDQLVADDPRDIEQTIRRFAQWHVLRRARRRSGYRDFTDSSGKWARQQVSVARNFLFWLADHDSSPEECTQALVDLWLASGNTRRFVIRDFIAWGKRDGLIAKTIKVPLRVVRQPSTPIEEADRWETLRTLFTDDAIPDDLRVAATLVLAYGQHVSRVVALRPEAVRLDGESCRVVVARSPLPLPGVLLLPLRRLVSEQSRGKSAIDRKSAGTRWLFPGGNPGHHITAERLRIRLAEHGITLRDSRHAALLQWAQVTPAPILASALGLHINTAVAWRDSLQADYTEFLAARGSNASTHV